MSLFALPGKKKKGNLLLRVFGTYEYVDCVDWFLKRHLSCGVYLKQKEDPDFKRAAQSGIVCVGNYFARVATSN